MRRSRSSAALLAVVAVACGGAPKPVARPACPTGPVVLAGDDDVAAVAGCTALRALTIRTGAALDLAPLARLERIDGDLRVGPSVGLEDVALPALRRVGGAIDVAGNGNLHRVRLPVLARAARLAIEGNVALTTISLPALAAVDGAVAITQNSDLELLDFTALATVGGELAIADNPQLTLLDLPAAGRAASVRVANNPALPADVVEALRARAPAR